MTLLLSHLYSPLITGTLAFIAILAGTAEERKHLAFTDISA